MLPSNYLVTELPSYSSLKKYLHKKNSCLEEIHFVDYVPILPKYMSNVKEGILTCLRTKILVYDDALEAIVIAIDPELDILTKYGEILYEDPRPFYKVSAHMIIIKLFKGVRIKGVVKRVTKRHVCVLIYGSILASVHFSAEYPNHIIDEKILNKKIKFVVEDIKVYDCTMTVYGLFSSRTIKKYAKFSEFSVDLIENSDPLEDLAILPAHKEPSLLSTSYDSFMTNTLN